MLIFLLRISQVLAQISNTPSEIPSENPSQLPSNSPSILACGSSAEKLEITIGTDDFPEQTTWNVVRQSTNEIILQGGPYSERNKLFGINSCLTVGTYKFSIYDSAGNGIKGEGYYSARLFDTDLFIRLGSEGLDFFVEEYIFGYCNQDSDCNNGNPCEIGTCSQSACQFQPTTVFSSSCRSFGNPKVLALRVIAADTATSSTVSELSNYIFGTSGKTLSMKSQYTACSFRKFNPQPFNGNSVSGVSISGGTSEVTIASNVKGQAAGNIVDLVVSAASAKLGNLQSQFNLVMLCLPPGTLIGTSSTWRAYAFVNNYLSIYNDQSCNYPSVQMHEIGHNIGLSHSNEDTNYGDTSGMMGLSLNQLDAPIKCFNGPKSFALGWYFESHLVIDSKRLLPKIIYSFLLVSIPDFLLRGNLPTILKIINSSDGFDYYITFNRATGFNAGTNEGANQVLVSRRNTGSYYADSILLAKLDNGSVSTIFNFDGSTGLRILPIYQNFATPTYDINLSKDNLECQQDNQCADSNSCIIGTCDLTEGRCIYTSKTCSECGGSVKIDVTTNEYPQHLQWEMADVTTGAVIRSSGYFPEPNKAYNDTTCQPFGSYRFTVIYGETRTLSKNVTVSVNMGDLIIDQFSLGKQSENRTSFTICSNDSQCKDYDGCYIDNCDTTYNICLNNLRPDGNCVQCSSLDLLMTSDNFPEENTWSIREVSTNALVLSGDPYPVFTFGNGRRSKPTRSTRGTPPTRSISRNLQAVTIDETICLENSFTYQFILTDSFGDGICCAEGAGSYQLLLKGTQVKNGGNFLSLETYLFKLSDCNIDSQCNDGNECTIDKCHPQTKTCYYETKPCIQCGEIVTVGVFTDFYAFAVTWKIEMNGISQMSGGPFLQSYQMYQVSKCLQFGSYTMTIIDTHADGLVTCAAGLPCGYYLDVGTKRLRQGKVFSTEVTPFIVDVASNVPSLSPSISPSDLPSMQPSNAPSTAPSFMPSLSPSASPSNNPSDVPSLSIVPSDSPSKLPTTIPSITPSDSPSTKPSLSPSSQPSKSPSDFPSMLPSISPSQIPSLHPTTSPSDTPSVSPSTSPSFSPSKAPSVSPSDSPSDSPSLIPTNTPSKTPSSLPSFNPSSSPSDYPSMRPSQQPSLSPSLSPSQNPSQNPSLLPTSQPSNLPTVTCAFITVSITTDNNPQETSWEIKRVFNNELLMSGGNYQNPNTTYIETSCLDLVHPIGVLNQEDDFTTFQFIINDSAGNGLCCSAGKGNYNLKHFNVVIATGGSFAYREEIIFSGLDISFSPSKNPSTVPTRTPSTEPTRTPSTSPSVSPSCNPSQNSSYSPSTFPSIKVTTQRTSIPSAMPTAIPTNLPSKLPTASPTFAPSFVTYPTSLPTSSLTSSPTSFPSRVPFTTFSPSGSPSTLCPNSHVSKCDEFCTGKKMNLSCRKNCDYQIKKSCEKQVCPNGHIKKCNKYCSGKKKNKKCLSSCDFPVKKKCSTEAPTSAPETKSCPNKHIKKCDKFCEGKKNKKCMSDCTFPVKKKCVK